MERYCVRVKTKENIGSGVLLPKDETFYVLTAAHCLGDTEPNLSEISIQKQSDYASEFTDISCLRIIEYNLEHDFAVIETDYKEEDSVSYKYKLARGFIPENSIQFCGYQNINLEQYRPFKGRVISVSDDLGKFKISLTDETLDQGGEDGQFIARGLSGSGVFIYRHSSPFLIGILNSVIDEKAWNDDINCCSIKHLDKYINEYVDLSNFENLLKWNENLEKARDEKEIELFKNEQNDFFEKLYRKNQVLYPEITQANKVTTSQIRKFLAMRDNIKELQDDYPELFRRFKVTVKKFVDQVEDEYSRGVNNSGEAINLKMQLNIQLKDELDFLPELTNIDLSDYQVIEWLGMCTLNFTKND